MQPELISIIVVSTGVELWNQLTVPALEGLNEHAGGAVIPYEIIVIDIAGLGRGDINFDQPRCYAACCNAGVEASNGDWLLILNNDILVNGPFLHLLAQASEEIEGPTLMMQGHPECGNIYYIEGWCISISRRLWDEIGGMDEGYENSWDDVRLSYEAHKRGYELRVLKNFPMKHLGHKTLGVMPEGNARHNAQTARFWEEFKADLVQKGAR